MTLPAVIVTNFKRRLTGVTTTALHVTAAQQRLADYDLGLCGPWHRLKLVHVLFNGFAKPPGKPFRIWHVRRNSEMLWGLIAKYGLGQPVRLVFTSASIRRHSAFPRWLIARMDAIVATSDKAASFLPRVDLIQGHGVDLNLFRPGDKSGTLTLVCAGRIRADKGTHILVAALCAVLPEFPKVRVHILGRAHRRDKAYVHDMQAKLQNAEVSAQVTWHGEVPPARVAEMLATAQLYAATPLHEEFGLTPFEGLASGCAVLVSDTGVFDQAVASGQTGILVPVGNVAATIAGLRTLLNDQGLRARMMAAARPMAQAQFSIDQEASALLGLYDRMWGL